ncbi:putative Nucleoporin complex subunit 54 [Blattamonas nauphoetae]|uniref:Nucleoporin complex subunit 54 n=1 Tax=Blattamonas nauphoetae TaxID=2049346 RepID=A0ABQ9WPD2_9EUKA|nr:putative Nucleoporin complex subunit 54 [Blattamonas nauphoetae]
MPTNDPLSTPQTQQQKGPFGGTPGAPSHNSTLSQGTSNLFTGSSTQAKTGQTQFGTGTTFGTAGGFGKPATGFGTGTGFQTTGGFGGLGQQPEQTIQVVDETHHAIEQAMKSLHPETGICPFRFVFYNDLPKNPTTPQKLFETPTGYPERLWREATHPKNLPEGKYPVAVDKFDGLRSRALHQRDTIQKQNAQLKDYESSRQQLSRAFKGSIRQRLLEMKETQLQIQQTIVKIMTFLSPLQMKGEPILPDEKHLATFLRSLQNEIDRPMQFRGLLGMIKNEVNQNQDLIDMRRGGSRLSQQEIVNVTGSLELQKKTIMNAFFSLRLDWRLLLILKESNHDIDFSPSSQTHKLTKAISTRNNDPDNEQMKRWISSALGDKKDVEHLLRLGDSGIGSTLMINAMTPPKIEEPPAAQPAQAGQTQQTAGTTPNAFGPRV